MKKVLCNIASAFLLTGFAVAVAPDHWNTGQQILAGTALGIGVALMALFMASD